jgi:hypothetical protein
MTVYLVSIIVSIIVIHDTYPHGGRRGCKGLPLDVGEYVYCKGVVGGGF